jgi:hypothetical protein
LEQFAESYWVPVHSEPEEAARAILVAFKRTIAARLELLELKAEE